MSDDLKQKVSGFLGKARNRATEALNKQSAALVRGRVAGQAVRDDSGELIADAGQTIDETILERAAKAGKLPALVAAVAMGQAQDLKERASELYARSADGKEQRALDSVEDYAAARRYLGHYTGMDVTDIRGNVVVPADTKIGEENIRAAREAGLLQALVFAARQGGKAARTPATPATAEPGYQPPPDLPPARRKKLPIVKQPE